MGGERPCYREGARDPAEGGVVSVESYALIATGVVLAGLVGWVIFLQMRLARMSRQYARLMRGVEGKNLEEVLYQHVDEVHEALDIVRVLQAERRRMDRTLGHAFQWMGMVRYNPFRNTGGDQSFVWAIVDGHGDGVVLSSLHSRDSTRLYAKPLHDWASSYALTEEEREAIDRAAQQRDMG
jgi:hypothetical protein